MKTRTAVVSASLTLALAGGCNVSFQNPGTGKDDGGTSECVGCHPDVEIGGMAGTDACPGCDTGESVFDATEVHDAISAPDFGFPDAGCDVDAPFDGGDECQTDFQCPDLARPHCGPVVRHCVGCYADSHCPGGVCNLIEYACKTADDAGTDAGAETETPDSGGSPDAGVPDAGPLCAQYTCLCDSYCTVQNEMPACVSGCRYSGDCCTGRECVDGYCDWTRCTSDSDCTAPFPYCDTNDGFCVECVFDDQCQHTRYCDPMTHTCMFTDTWCNPPCDATIEYCDEGVKMCRPKSAEMCRPCTGAPDCVDVGLICGTSSKQCTKQCTLDSDCMGFTCGLLGFCACP